MQIFKTYQFPFLRIFLGEKFIYEKSFITKPNPQICLSNDKHPYSIFRKTL